jgi:glutamate-1-semialdehyde 2,1-aminomutase
MYYSHGERSRIFDVDGNAFLDYSLAWGPNILGHPPHPAAEAIERQVKLGLTYGAQHELEYLVAEKLVAAIPCAGLVTYCNSGTEIVQVALRMARAATGRKKFLKFEGAYHGWHDSVLVSHHPSQEQVLSANGAPVPAGAGQWPSPGTIIAEWNSPQSVQQAFANYKNEISAVICEPLLANSGCIPPEPGFLELLRDITVQHGALLIFDEVITGFRLDYGGAQTYYGVTPDLATYGKAVGAGTPLSVLAGKREYMELIGNGKVIHAGTLNGNPLCLAAANAALDYLAGDGGSIYKALHQRGERLRTGIESILRNAGLEVVTNGAGPVFDVSFMTRKARNYRDTLAADRTLYSDFALALLDEGILVLPDGRWYLSAAHTDEDLNTTLEAVHRTVSFSH